MLQYSFCGTDYTSILETKLKQPESSLNFSEKYRITGSLLNQPVCVYRYIYLLMKNIVEV